MNLQDPNDTHIKKGKGCVIIVIGNQFYKKKIEPRLTTNIPWIAIKQGGHVIHQNYHVNLKGDSTHKVVLSHVLSVSK